MTGNEIRSRFLKFFEERGHTIVPSAPLVPENDPSVLFNTAGMQPLVPYLMGQPHPSGSRRIADSQKCVRTNDIDEVGDNTHLTFFEMLGNWSLGDYFKEEAINWSFEFLTSKENGHGLDPRRLYVTVFKGDENAPQDIEAYEIWKKIFEYAGFDPKKRIFFMNADSNWWSPGDNGPCGPDSEMFYDVTGTLTEGMTREEFIAADERQAIVEIWNDVFMEYEKKDGRVVGKLKMQNVDTGSGLERVTGIVQGKDNVFDTDLFLPILQKISSLAKTEDTRAARIIADHIRSSVFLIADGVSPSNTDQGYILRRLLRRAVRYANTLGMPEQSLADLVPEVVTIYKDAYPNIFEKQPAITQVIGEEERKFRITLEKGLKQFNKISIKLTIPVKQAGKNIVRDESKEQQHPETFISGKNAFELFTTYGFPIELTEEIAKEKGMGIDRESFDTLMEEHRALSRKGAEQKFKGGLADHSDKVVQYHTATHLMLAGLRKELGREVHQAGSNITGERLRFDFTYPEKVSRETLDNVEKFVNHVIEAGAKVTIDVMDKEQAHKDPTIEGSFWEKYPDKVTVYTVTGSDGTVYSRELCGGPHVENTADIKGVFKITKEESSSSGIRRVKAILE